MNRSLTRPGYPVLRGPAVSCLLFSFAVAVLGANYDESKVPVYQLPDALKTEDGKPVKDRAAWEKRRAEILDLFRTHMYGHTPAKPVQVTFRVEEESDQALGGTATRRQVSCLVNAPSHQAQMNVLFYIPHHASQQPVPLIIIPNFRGNHTTVKDPRVSLPEGAEDQSRGDRAGRWPVERIIARGYALATFWYHDVVVDRPECFGNGMFPLFYEAGQTKPGPDEWGAIGAWAWGLSRVLDYAEKDGMLDETKTMVVGHSRLGKTALWAGAQDERFAIVVSNDSGCGGAALSRRRFGESVKRINDRFPHWFCGNFKKYNDNENRLPIDQHMLLALIAPRPVYVASAEKDQWADPKGEFLSVLHADPVYRLLGTKGFPASTMPKVDQPVFATMGYHVRTGKHDITTYDWERYMDFGDAHFKR